jgi:aminoglycoside 6'-N-acetyltransferase I
MRIIDLVSTNESAIQQVTELLVEGFATNWPFAWPDMESALEEVHESFGTDRISRIAVDEDGTVLGWIGGISQYRGHVWELHPLVVRVNQQGNGIGRALVADLEARDEFYQKQGFVIIGVMPDANGLGKPDILMAKSVVR